MGWKLILLYKNGLVKQNCGHPGTVGNCGQENLFHKLLNVSHTFFFLITYVIQKNAVNNCRSDELLHCRFNVSFI